ncbi:CaiB/BaiF CoA-transferase family protein [Acidisoma sp. S159]|uniref:CaiB/BaiF CoA transferase family protein n=1 Tax=Acidisoma sp. S159 TaxID=1747225 RepID=UPI00131E3C9D|nr:CoA transferase [Acidisoma sp. S159]
MTGSLQDLKVLDLSRFIAGPLCGMLLGDMGADVVKVERRGKGEDARGIAPFVGDESLYAMMYNRNKRGLTLDFRHPGAAILLRALIAEADVLIENFRAGTMEEMGLGWETLRTINPRLIMVRISGFGQDGPYATHSCLDVVAQAMSGIMEMTGTPDGPPLPAGTFIVDQVTGLYATIGALGALNARHATGRGQMVDAALMDSAVTLLLTAIPQSLLFGENVSRQGARDRYSAPANNYATAEGRWVHLNAGNNIMFPRLCAAMERLDLLNDPRFATHAARMANVAEIEAIVADWVHGFGAEEVVALLTRAQVPCGKVATIDEVVRNPQLLHREQIVEIDHPTIGKLPMHGVTVRFSETKNAIRRPAPSIGEHRRSVLADWLNYTEDQVTALETRGVI